MVHAVVNTASDAANIRSAGGLSMFQERNSGDGSRTGPGIRDRRDKSRNVNTLTRLARY